MTGDTAAAANVSFSMEADKKTNSSTSDGAPNDGEDHAIDEEPLPNNRFELELEFLQALASPAYLHFLASSRSDDGLPLLQDPALQDFLRYLRETWTKPEYIRFIQYPDALYFLNLLLDRPAVLTELSLTQYRNFCHQQQFLAWQHRHATNYGVGKQSESKEATGEDTIDNKEAT